VTTPASAWLLEDEVLGIREGRMTRGTGGRGRGGWQHRLLGAARVWFPVYSYI